MITDEEKALIEGCIRGERTSQQAFYRRYAGRMFAVCLRYTKNEDEAKDVLQDGFIKTFEALPSFRRHCPLDLWVRKIMINTALKYLRKQKRSILFLTDFNQTEETNLAGQSADDGFSVQFFETEELMAAVQNLAPGYQIIFNLFAVEGYSHKEIAEQLGISESTSKSQYFRARKHLRQYLEQLQQIRPEYSGSTQIQILQNSSDEKTTLRL